MMSSVVEAVIRAVETNSCEKKAFNGACFLTPYKANAR
jgi:hypothetical protein